MQPRAFADATPQSAIPSSRIWESTSSAETVRTRRDRRFVPGGCRLTPLSQGLKRSPEKVVVPLYQALESKYRDASQALADRFDSNYSGISRS